jgi:hypothetical protein
MILMIIFGKRSIGFETGAVKEFMLYLRQQQTK